MKTRKISRRDFLKATAAIGAAGVLTACGGGSTQSTAGTASSGSTSGGSASADKLVVWTLADDLNKFAAKYQEETGVNVEVITIEQANYPTKVQTALLAGEKEPDIIVGEPQMLEDFYDAGFFADLDEFGAQDYAGQVVDYVWQLGQDADGVQRAISYQVTPAAIYYRRAIAQEVFGTDDPDQVSELFKDYPTILDTAKKVRSAGYRIFASDSEISYFTHDSAWVVDGALNLTQAKRDYMDLCVDLYQQDLVAYANAWSTPWRQAMAGEISALTAGSDEAAADADTTMVFAFGLPSWGIITMKNSGAAPDAGEWGLCTGPAPGFGGGTFIGISSQSARKDAAWEFVKFCTLNEDTANWWIDESGDVVSLVSVLEAHHDDVNPFYGDQKFYAFWQEMAEQIDASTITSYDTPIGEAWAAAISAIKTGESTKEDAIKNFYDQLESTYPELAITRE